jgi:hypothetical protein
MRETFSCRHCGRCVRVSYAVVHAATGLATCSVAVQRHIPGKTTRYVLDGRYSTTAELRRSD